MSLISNRFGFCPVCKLYLHHAFLVVENTKADQKVGLVCDGCKSLNVSITRSRATLQVTDRYCRHGFHVNSIEETRNGSKISNLIGGQHD